MPRRPKKVMTSKLIVSLQGLASFGILSLSIRHTDSEIRFFINLLQ